MRLGPLVALGTHGVAPVTDDRPIQEYGKKSLLDNLEWSLGFTKRFGCATNLSRQVLLQNQYVWPA